tara:strand:- start:1062 stop:2633 length:1572 start_codon:yes stop_codon:yes gene_type:complete
MLNLLSNLRISGLIDNVDNFIDIGAQTLTRNTHNEIKRFINAFGGTVTNEEIKDWYRKNPPFPAARRIFEKTPITYDCLDSSSETLSSVLGKNFDLNFDKIPDEMRNKYDFVCDIGTLEHVFNQENSFSCCHDLTSKDGYMLHFLPTIGFSDAAYFNCLPRLFFDIAEYNDYSEEGMWSNFSYSEDLTEWDPELLRYIDVSTRSMHDINIVSLWRRTSNKSFQKPVIDEKKVHLSGYRRHILTILCDAFRYGMITEINSVADLGQQPLDMTGAEAQVQSLVELMGGPASHAPITDPASLFGAAGKKHETISFSDVAHDRNLAEKNKYDLVTNIGVSDKIFDFGRMFERMHAMTAPGGAMLHVVPFFGNDDNSYYTIMPTLMEELAIVNGYKILGAWLHVDGLNSALYWDDNHFRSLDINIKDLDGSAYYIALFQKVHDTEFNIPFQFKYRELRSEHAAQRYRLNLNGQNVVDWPLRKIDSRRELVGRIGGQYSRGPLTKPRALYKTRFLPLSGAKNPKNKFPG